MIAVDFNNRGHHPGYLAKLIAAGWSGDLVTTTRSIERVATNLPPSLAGWRGRVTVVDLLPEDFSRQVGWMNAKGLGRGAVHLAIDDLFGAMIRRPSFWLRRGGAWSGLWMSSNFFYKRAESYKYQLVWAMFRLFVWREVGVFRRQKSGRLLFLNEELAECLRANPALEPWIGWCPDPPDPFGEIDVFDGSPEKTVLFFGEHLPRKGTEWALEALAGWQGPPVKVVVAGEWKGTRPLDVIWRDLPPNVRLEIRAGYLSGDESAELFRKTDVVALPYRRFGGSSGVFNTALAVGNSVVVPDFGLLASRCRVYGTGEIFAHDSKEGFCAALGRALGSGAAKRALAARKTFLEKNDLNCFRSAFETAAAYTGC